MKKRNSNMELLRIVAMLMIVAFHIFRHCINIQLTDANSIAALGNGWYSYPAFSKKLCLLAIISPMVQIGNAIFLIISGYFMVNKDDIDLTKISMKLLLQLGFAAFSLGLISILAYQRITTIPIKLLSFNSFNWMSWYVGYYFMVIVLAKVFLNKFLSKLNKNDYIMFLLTIFALTQFSWSASIISNICGGLETLCTGVFLYSMGGYIKKYNPFDSVKSWFIIALIAIINIIVIGNFYIVTADNILSYVPNGENIFLQSIPLYVDTQIIPIILGIAIFELFRRIKISNNKIINFIGSSTFMIYLIHDNEFFYKIWNAKDWITLLYESLSKFIMTFGIYVLLTFGAGFIGYCIFLLLGKIWKIFKPLIMKKTT